MNGINRINKNHYIVRVYATDHRVHPPKKVERTKTVRGSFAQAKQMKTELEQRLQIELSGVGERMTLTAFAQRWLEAREKELAPSTKEKYVNDLEKYILPALGDFFLDQLRPGNIQEMLARDPGAPNSRKNRLTLMRKLCKDARRDGHLERDFCLGVTVKVPPVYTESEPNSLSGEELERVIAVMPEYWYDVAAMSSYTGLRWGEVSAFHWADLDLFTRLATVRYTNWKGILRRPKTDMGLRTLPLVQPLVHLLSKRRRRMEAEKHPGLRRDLVFPTQRGTLHKGTPLRAVLQAACKEAGITIRFTPHGLRRTWNNLARRISGGLVVRSMIGHASEAMTDLYSFVNMDEKRATAEAVAREMGTPGEQASQTSGVLAGGPVPAGVPEWQNPE